MSGPWWLRSILSLCLIGLTAALLPVGAAADAPVPPNALILYDSIEPYGWIGELHAILTANLLGHFPLDYTIQPVEDYTPGEMEEYGLTFYFGTDYNNTLPEAFLSDVMSTDRTVCWLGYNLWQLAWNPDQSWNRQFTDRYGFQFAGVDSTGYPEILYQGESLSKDQNDPDIGVTLILDPDRAQVLAEAHRPATETEPEATAPYVVHSGNLWYFADTVMTYMSEESRYLVFCDLIHDIVGIDHAVRHPALIRIEDINPTSDPGELKRVARYLRRRRVPFQMAVIPVYKDPFGVEHDGVPTEIHLSQSPDVCDAIEYMENRGGQIFLHGYTHQYDSTENPYDGVTADDFEFFTASFTPETGTELLGPVPEDSVSWVNDRVDMGLAELAACGFTPVAWETPHYSASALDYTEFGKRFSLCSGRQLYFTQDGEHFAGQFFPYPIKRDIYGQRISPENLGNVEPFPFYDYPTRFPEDIIRAAEKNLVIRDGWAAAYFHPYYDLDYLKDLIRGIKDLGFKYTVAPTMIADAGPDKEIMIGESTTLEGSASMGKPEYKYQWTPADGLSDPNIARPTASPTLSTTYELTVTDRKGQVDHDLVSVTVIWPVPEPDFSATPTSGVTPLEVTFTDASTNNPTSWSWNFGDGYSSTDQNPVHIYHNDGGTTLAFTVSLTASNPGGSDTETKADYITVTPLAPAADFTASPVSGAAPLTVAFTDTSTNNPTSWSWDFGDGSASTEQNPSHTYENSGGTTRTFTVSLTATNDGGSDTETKADYISVVPPAPSADFSASPTNGTTPLTVQFTDTSTNNPTSWSWDFGDGATSAEQNPSHTYENAGGTTRTFTVSLTATNDGGSDTETKADYISVVPPAPSADFSASPTSGTTPLTVAFTDASTNNPTSWSWDFGDGATSAEQNPTHTYDSPGIYDVTLTATGPGGSDTTTRTDCVHVDFPDVPEDHWAYSYIMACVKAGVVQGYWDGYHPDDVVNRAQMTVFVARALAGGDDAVPPGPSSPTFSDVPPDYWAYKYIEYCYAQGIVSGYWDGYHPNELVNRAQMAVYVARARAGGDENVPAGPATATFSDVPIDYWAFKYVEYCHAQGIVQGYGDSYHPEEQVDRAQMAVFIQRAFDLPM